MSQMSERIKKLNLQFRRASLARGTMIEEKSRWEEFYYNDVESTLSQYSEDQLASIKSTFNMPVSTKLTFPVIEQLLAFLTSTKPEPKLISPNESLKDFAEYSQQGFQGIWYESKANRELKDALRDKLNVGSGWLHIRTNDYYNESTFNVVIERVDWKKVFIDPECQKSDLSDADYVFIAEVLRKERAERKYDIKIKKGDAEENNLAFYTEVGDLFDNVYLDYFATPFSSEGMNEKEQFVLVRRGYVREETSIYISETGDISLKRPKSISIVNPEREKLEQQMIAIEKQLQQLDLQASHTAMKAGESQDSYEQGISDGESDGKDLNDASQLDQQGQSAAKDYNTLMDQYNALKRVYGTIPVLVPAFEMDLGIKDKAGKETTKVVMNVKRIRKKIYKMIVIVGDTIVSERVLPSSMVYYPLIHLGFLQKGATYKTFGILHQIIDLVKAMNKVISLTILDMSINSNRKVLYWRGTVIEPAQVESSFAQPGSWTELIPDPSLPKTGEPIIIEPSPVNQNFLNLISIFSSFIESITGMAGISRGMQPDISSQDAKGGSLSIQNSELGTSRAKMYGRSLEDELEILSHVVIAYLHAYAPKEKELVYFDGENKEQFLQIPNLTEDLQFKVRVDIVSAMPTIRNLAAESLAKIAQTAGDPTVATMLVQYYLKLIDLPQSEEWIQKMDVAKQYQEQITQLQDELKKKEANLQSLENNLVQIRISKEVAEKRHGAEQNVAVEEAKATKDVQNQVQNNQRQGSAVTEPADLPFI